MKSTIVLFSLIWLVYLGIAERLPTATIPVCESEPSVDSTLLCNSAYFRGTKLFNDVNSGHVSKEVVPLTVVAIADNFANFEFDYDDFSRGVYYVNQVWAKTGIRFEPTYMALRRPQHLKGIRNRYCAAGSGVGHCTESNETAPLYWDYVRTILGQKDRASYGVIVVVADSTPSHSAYAKYPLRQNLLKNIVVRDFEDEFGLLDAFVPAYMAKNKQVKTALAHEIGHLFGVMHTHDCEFFGSEPCFHPWLTGDFVGDTPPQAQAQPSWRGTNGCTDEDFLANEDSGYSSYTKGCFGNDSPSFWPRADWGNTMGYSDDYCLKEPSERATVGQSARFRCFYDKYIKERLASATPDLSLGVEVSFPYTWVIGGTYEAGVSYSETLLELFVVPGHGKHWIESNTLYSIEFNRPYSGMVNFRLLRTDNGPIRRGVHTVFAKVRTGFDESAPIVYKRSAPIDVMSSLCESSRSFDDHHAFGVCSLRSVCEAVSSRYFEDSEACAFGVGGVAPDDSFGCCLQRLRDVSLGSSALGVHYEGRDNVEGVAAAAVAERRVPRIAVSGLLMAGERIRVRVTVSHVASVDQVISQVRLYVRNGFVGAAEAHALDGDRQLPIEIDRDTSKDDEQFDVFVYIPDSWAREERVFRVELRGRIASETAPNAGRWWQADSFMSAEMTADAPPCMADDTLGELTSGTCLPSSADCAEKSVPVDGLCGTRTSLVCCLADARASEGAYRRELGPDETSDTKQLSPVSPAIIGVAIGVILCLCMLVSVVLVLVVARQRMFQTRAGAQRTITPTHPSMHSTAPLQRRPSSTRSISVQRRASSARVMRVRSRSPTTAALVHAKRSRTSTSSASRLNGEARFV